MSVTNTFQLFSQAEVVRLPSVTAKENTRKTTGVCCSRLTVSKNNDVCVRRIFFGRVVANPMIRSVIGHSVAGSFVNDHPLCPY